MNPSASITTGLTDHRQRQSNVRSRILKNEEQRLQLEQKLRLMASHTSRPYQRKQIQHIQTYFNRLNDESQRAEQRNLQILNDLTQAQEHLDKLHFDAEHLIHLKNDYVTYLESHYPNWQRPPSSSSTRTSHEEYDRLVHEMKLESEGNLRHVRQSYDADSSMLVKRYEDQLKDRTISPPNPMINNPEQTLSDSNDIVPNHFSRGIRHGSLQMKLSQQGLYFLLDYIEDELKETIDKKKFYRFDPPTINQKRTVLDIANDRKKSDLQDLDPTTVSMVILDQLPSTIRRTTMNKCLLTDEILSSNIKDLDKSAISQMLPEQDRFLWLRLIDHFTLLLKLHIMNCQTLVNKFALVFLPTNVSYAHDKAKSLLKHILEKLVGTQSSSSDDEISSSKTPPIAHAVSTNVQSKTFSWMKKSTDVSSVDDDDESSSSSTEKLTGKDNSADEFFH